MIVKWLGHSCFEIYGQEISVITDPYDETVGYPILSTGADYVTISHHHRDHSDTSWIIGCTVVEGVGTYEFPGVKFKGIPSYHDRLEGKMRGENTIFRIELDDMVFCHLGDLGHLIDEKIWREIGRVDVLFLPIGGNYTIGAKDAERVMEAIDPRLTIAMHFANDACKYPIDSQEEFLRITGGTQMNTSSVKFTKEELSRSKNIIALQWARD